MSRWEPPSRFDEYRIVRPLGAGAVGAVYLAHDETLDRAVAIKFLSTDASFRARERFANEARAIARLQHPNVLAVFRVGSVEGRPYLVSEYVRGTTLRDLPLPVPAARVIEIATALARGLAAAHRSGVLHRDIKPGNAMLAENGEIKLLDFGLAKLQSPLGIPEPDRPDGDVTESADMAADDDASPEPLSSATEPGTLMGSPLYMSPEAWRGEPATTRTDVYSLGILIYELATGAAPFSQLTPRQLARTLATEDPPVARFGHEALEDVIRRCIARKPDDRFADGDAVLEALERLVPKTAVPIPEGNPFLGLRAFSAEERGLFFGRERDIRAVIDRLRSDTFALVAGDSGVGKSSLCRAGVVPAFEAEMAAQGQALVTASITPGRQPTVALASALAHLCGMEETEALRQVRDGSVQFSKGGGTKLLFVDQLEELLTQSDAQEGALAARALGALITSVPSFKVIAAVRADFLGRVAALAGLGDEVSRALYLLRPLRPDALRDAIVGPLRATSHRFESAGTVDALVSAAHASAGSLPLLQFALAELWERRDTVTKTIPADALEALGGVEGCLARHADGVLASLPPAGRTAARHILLALVTGENTAGRRTEEELARTESERRALETLVRGRLVVAKDASSGGESAYQISHDALISRWATLREWLDASAHDRARAATLERAASEWLRLQRPADQLLGDKQLQELLHLDTAATTPLAAEYLRASARAARRRRWSRRTLAVSVPAVILLALTPLAKTRYDARQRHAFQVQAAQLADEEAKTRVVEARRMRSEAFAAFDSGSEGAETQWRAAVEATWEAQNALAQAARAWERALELSGADAAVRDAVARALSDKIRFAEELEPGRKHGALRAQLARFDEGGVHARSLDAEGTLHVDTADGARVWIESYALVSGRFELQRTVDAGAAPLEWQLPPGSYVVRIDEEGKAPIRVPVLLGAGEWLRVRIPLPEATDVPEGFVYVPPGRFLMGSADENLRKGWLNAQPLHAVETEGYLISRYEVTIGDWLLFLRALPSEERKRRTPDVQSFHRFKLTPTRGGAYELTLSTSGHTYVAREGEKIRYAERDRRAEQDWMRMPIAGISFEDAQAYASWLASTGRVPGARLCTDREWERAGRGADGRLYPSGDVVGADDINQDITYGKKPGGYGPDEVGAHPASRSPFGVDDLSGNVWEWVMKSAQDPTPVLRGGCWYMGDISSLLPNREETAPTIRDAVLGMRVCAEAPMDLKQLSKNP